MGFGALPTRFERKDTQGSEEVRTERLNYSKDGWSRFVTHHDFYGSFRGSQVSTKRLRSNTPSPS